MVTCCSKGERAMATLTHEDVRVVLGPVDDSLVAEIVATGASPEELAEAYAWVTNDEALMNIGRPQPLASSRSRTMRLLCRQLSEAELVVPDASAPGFFAPLKPRSDRHR
jgi:hypothetical protein